MRVNTKIVDDFQRLQKELPNIIDRFGLKHASIYTDARIPHATYYRKLKSQGFDAEEMQRICKAINR